MRNLGIPKGGNNRYQSKEKNISNGMLNGWIKKQLELGKNGFQNSKKLDNPLVKYSRKKQLTDLEKL